MLVRQILLAIIGSSAGAVAAGGLFAFIVELGVISDFADRTHTAEHIRVYETCVALGGIFGNLFWLYQIPVPGGIVLAVFLGIFFGMFVGCWAMALAEILNLFPVFMRRLRLADGLPAVILGIAAGKVTGCIWILLQEGIHG